MARDILTTREVAERLGVTQARVRALIAAGRLPSQQFGRDHLIKESDLKLVEDRKPGRPSKKASGTDGKVTVKPSKKGGKK
ncbi:MAG: helix-turn-helix domain-containing protein [Acidobacteria bacterium]|jgi:excisionase family DNA binding protein|nr:helix-turn-helix domain-containing protein [Acidobacteriota bacterium]